MLITCRDIDITETLAYRVPFLTIEQVGTGWWPGTRTRHVLKRRLTKLIDRQLLATAEINLSPSEWAESPVAAVDSKVGFPNYDEWSDRLQLPVTTDAEPTSVVVAGPRAKNLFASDFIGLPGILERQRAQSLAAALVWHKQHGMASESWLSRFDAISCEVRRTGWDALIVNPVESLSVMTSIAICCRPISRRRWERLAEGAQSEWNRLEVW